MPGYIFCRMAQCSDGITRAIYAAMWGKFEYILVDDNYRRQGWNGITWPAANSRKKKGGDIGTDDGKME